MVGWASFAAFLTTEASKPESRSGRYKLSKTQQEEAIKMIRLGEKSQAEIAELFNVDRSTVSRMMKEVREKELLKAAR
jgi:DNA-binding CsgD family transcriptional regulator